ncbi:PEPxxWA-CTERM sorting domain-containing protein [Phenylobacterium sp.]|uniref:PEPxxWA-CTERM sorting domain-containing protein n=1 Tax=Phenylobacterium sp. TaxID=1871053 RepID=UPI0025F5CFD1|nr:PEPxxWA-CTERM sorting domain-containing protein [Phenylobacterium sp.]
MRLSFLHHLIRPALVALALTAASPAAATTYAFTGTSTNDTPPPTPSALCAAGEVRIAFSPANSTAAGTSNFGAFGPSLAHCLSLPPSSYSGGVFDFAFAAGDDLSGSYSGFFSPTATPGVLNNTVNFVVTGGTGRFLGATGAFQSIGTLDRRVPRPLNTGTFSGSLNLPAVPEPATWAMMILGFGLTGTAMRRRRVGLAV